MTVEKITSIQVAQLAGVSQSADTPGASASQQTVDKVRKAASELGYRPNVLARAMVSGKSRIIGLVVAYLDNQFYPDALEKLSTVLQQRGYQLLIFAASVAMSSDLAKRCRALNVPMVLFNRLQDDRKMFSVTTDNFSGGQKVADYLVSTNHQKIAYIAGWEFASTQRDREAGFVEGLAKHGAKLHAREVGNFTSEGASSATRKMFAQDPPDAVFVASDHMAFTVMDTLRYELGLSVPDDVSVIGFDDVPIASWPSYNLTTVRQRANRLVSKTVDLLLAQISGDVSDPRNIMIDAPLVVRGSVKLPEQVES